MTNRGGAGPSPPARRATRSEAEALSCYRRVRDEMGQFVSKLPQAVQNAEVQESRQTPRRGREGGA